MSITMKEKCNEPEYNALMSERMKKVWSDPNNREMYTDCLYQRHSDPDERKHVSDRMKEVCADPEYRKGMSKRQKENWNNPEYRNAIMSNNQDKIWVHNADSEKWIHEHELAEYQSQGCSLGRLLSRVKLTTTGKIRVHKGNQDKFVVPSELDSYLAKGWLKGRANRKHVKCVETGQIFDSVEECAKAFNTNIDLVHSRCKGVAKNFRRLKDIHFCYCDELGNEVTSNDT